jgi:hypothetical protein
MKTAGTATCYTVIKKRNLFGWRTQAATPRTVPVFLKQTLVTRTYSSAKVYIGDKYANPNSSTPEGNSFYGATTASRYRRPSAQVSALLLRPLLPRPSPSVGSSFSGGRDPPSLPLLISCIGGTLAHARRELR